MHHYYFRLYALSVAEPPVAPRARCVDFIGALEDAALEIVDLIGTYER